MKKVVKVVAKVVKIYLLASTLYDAYNFIQCRGLGKENDKQLLANVADRITGFEIDPDEIIKIKDDTLQVSYNPYMQVILRSMGGIACVINDTNEVYVDDRFRRMSKSTQYAILCHEMGHRHHGHTAGKGYAIKKIFNVMHGKVLDIELEADNYAASIVGIDAMIEALQEMCTYVHGLSRKEANLRIKHLEKKRKEVDKIYDFAAEFFKNMAEEVAKL